MCAAEIKIPQQDRDEIEAAGEDNEFFGPEDTIDWASLKVTEFSLLSQAV